VAEVGEVKGFAVAEGLATERSNGLAMISSEVQRTLVKSPPELWAELSDADSLGRHFGALGDIRITRSEPEKLVEWEADGTSGSVRIKPSGWGTKVTLSVTREVEADQATAAEPEPEPDSPGDQVTPLAETGEATEVDQAARSEVDEPVMAAAEEPTMVEVSEPVRVEMDKPMMAAVDEVEADEGKTIAFDALPQPEIARESRRGFFARMFGRLRARTEADSPPLPEHTAHEYEPATNDSASEEATAEEATAEEGSTEEGAAEQATAEAAEAQPGVPGTAIESLQARYATAAPPAEEPLETAEEPLEPVSEQAAEDTPGPVAEQVAEDTPEPPSEAAADLAAELKAAEEVTAEEVTAMLTAVLDRLGAAHHRPFSRS
jgi:hypothetical protein